MITNEMIEAAKVIAVQINKAMDGVTDGPWEVYEGCSWRRIGTRGPGYNDCAVLAPTVASDGHPDLTCHRGNDLHANLDYIALCNPANMRVLLSALDALSLLPGEADSRKNAKMLELYAASYSSMAKMGDGKVSASDVAYDIRHNMIKQLVAASPAPLPAVVKSLEWTEWRTGSRGWQVDTVLGQYQVAYLGEYEEWQLYCPNKSTTWEECFSRHSSSQDAKGAAQADYETRIRSALSSPVGGTEEYCRHYKGKGYQPGDPEGAPLESCTYRAGSGKSAPTPASDIAALREALAEAEPYVEICHSLMTQKETRANVWRVLQQVRSALQHVEKGERG